MLLGRSAGSQDWIGDFEAIYPDSDLEVIGTLAVRLALSAVARRVGAQAVVTGLNLEDVLAEYRCPKEIIDGCYPKLSLQNYADRYPSYMYWRAAAYHFAQQIGSTQTGMEFNLLDGFEILSKTSNRTAIYRPEIGFSIASEIKPEDLKQWQKFTSGDQRGKLQSIT